jgi:GNAT superfamily N-acetyltransferase
MEIPDHGWQGLAMPIRPAAPGDLPRLQEIEVAAGEAFRGVGKPEVADDDAFPLDVLNAYRRAGRAWVNARDTLARVPEAYLLMDMVDGLFHIEQVSVHPEAAGRGLGRELIEHLDAQAAQQQVPALTLTTFADVPWNAPYYARLGFTVLDRPGPELQAVRRKEAEHGLDRWPRIAMIRTVKELPKAIVERTFR